VAGSFVNAAADVAGGTCLEARGRPEPLAMCQVYQQWPLIGSSFRDKS
jgi:hypothetical protein